MVRKATLATCTLSQWALDFEGNLRRILESIRQAKEMGARYRLGPELEVPGYGCNDHFLEHDTLLHSWESLACILENPVCENILVDIGMPVRFQHSIYNCRVILLNKKILLIRPKMMLAMDEIYREQRWFCPWSKSRAVDQLQLPPIITKITGQNTVPFGDAILSTCDAMIGYETCEELFVPNAPHIDLTLQGVEVFMNASGSHHELRKLGRRIGMISEATRKNGGVYMYSNLRGCDGERVYYDGSSMIFQDGEMLAQAEQFSVIEVEVITATVDLDNIQVKRCYPQFGIQANRVNNKNKYQNIEVDFKLCHQDGLLIPVSQAIQPVIVKPEEEIASGPACWLWDYLRRSGCNGFFLPLSGGIDSSSTACIVACMCRMLIRTVKRGGLQTLNDIRGVVQDPNYIPSDPSELCNRIFVTCYMGTENSSTFTRDRASHLARDIGSYHLGIVIDTAIKALVGIFSTVTNKTPRFRVHGGTTQENLALQNVQARTRMVLSYLFAQLTLWSRGQSGNLLVLGSANVDESLVGYMTKYDCSSADLNPIGGISKTDLKKFVFYCVEKYNYTSLIGILGAKPTAELEPLKDGQIQQTDEQDMGLTYDELSLFGRLRKIQKCGPYSMFTKLLTQWSTVSPTEIATKVKLFFKRYAVNRHKMTTVTPSYHAEAYSPDDNRCDLRQILYRSSWPWQFRSIDRAVLSANKFIVNSSIEGCRASTTGGAAPAGLVNSSKSKEQKSFTAANNSETFQEDQTASMVPRMSSYDLNNDPERSTFKRIKLEPKE